MAKKNELTFAGLCSGCGGFDLGFEAAGFKSRVAIDNDPIAVQTYNRNLEGDATQLDLAAQEIRLPKVDVILAGPPCQGFSTLGKRQREDPRNALFNKVVEIAAQAKPKVIVIENVTGVASGNLSDFFDNACDALKASGYFVHSFKIRSDQFGLPQVRKRMILLASQVESNGLTLPTFRSRSLGEVLAHPCKENHEPRVLKRGTDQFQIAKKINPNQKLSNVRGGERAVPTWEIPEVFGKVTTRQIETLILIRQIRRQIRRRDHGDADPVSIVDIRARTKFDPKSDLQKLVELGYLKIVNNRFDFTHAFNGKFRRLSNEHTSPAVDTRFGQPRYFLHPTENRGLSVREAARIQGFPDEFVFEGNLTQQYRQAGNAVSPVIGEWLATEIKEKLL